MGWGQGLGKAGSTACTGSPGSAGWGCAAQWSKTTGHTITASESNNKHHCSPAHHINTHQQQQGSQLTTNNGLLCLGSLAPAINTALVNVNMGSPLHTGITQYSITHNRHHHQCRNEMPPGTAHGNTGHNAARVVPRRHVTGLSHRTFWL